MHAISRRFLDGWERKEQGQLWALETSGKEWVDKAVLLLGEFLRTCGEGQFRFEEFRAWATADERLNQPASQNAWGALPRIAAGQGLIEWTGEYQQAKSPRTHAHPVKVWRAKANPAS